MAGNNSTVGLETITFTDNMSFDGTERGGAMTTNGQLWIGSTLGRHVKLGSITSPLGTLTVGYSSPNITLDLVGGSTGIDSFIPDSGTSPVVPTAAGAVTMSGAGSITTVGGLNSLTTQLQNMTNHAVLVGAGTTTLTKLAVGTNGQVLIASTAADPAFATITSSGGTVAFTLGANTLNMEVAAGGFIWVDATGATQALLAQHGYVTDRGGGVTYTLPASGTLGDIIKIVGKLGIAVITPNANQQILIGSTSGTVGVTGTATANNVGDCIELVCITAGASTVWRADSVIGTWTLA